VSSKRCGLYLDKTEIKNGETIVKMQPARYLAVRLIEKEDIVLDNDERWKLTPTSAKLWIP
jgi:hypothetical protein